VLGISYRGLQLFLGVFNHLAPQKWAKWGLEDHIKGLGEAGLHHGDFCLYGSALGNMAW